MIYLFASGKGRQESKVSKKQSIIKKWQKACLARAIDLRFSEIRKSEYLDKEEVDVLSSLKDMSFTSWDKLSKEIGSEKAYGIVNSTLLDMAYKTAFIKKEQAIESLVLIDIINNGIQTTKKGYVPFPEGLDIKATIINILSDINPEDIKIVSKSEINNACVEIASTDKWGDISDSAKKTTIKILLDTIGNDIYDYSSYNRKIETENKIYIRIIVSLLSCMEYDKILEDFDNKE